MYKPHAAMWYGNQIHYHFCIQLGHCQYYYFLHYNIKLTSVRINNCQLLLRSISRLFLAE